ATANALTAPDAPKMHSESTTTESGAAVNSKTKTEVVIGTVKEYEAGKSIKVTGPDAKDYSFDLTDMAIMKKAVTVGERVKVTFTKLDGGSKATTIVAYPHKGCPGEEALRPRLSARGGNPRGFRRLPEEGNDADH